MRISDASDDDLDGRIMDIKSSTSMLTVAEYSMPRSRGISRKANTGEIGN